jgi:hypothetical protein
MKIAILAWGSLIWNPLTLRFDNSIGWLPNGPKLPIEFARISSDGRLTLVIKEGSDEVQTYYGISLYSEIDEAIFDLALREGCPKKRICCVDKSEKIDIKSLNSIHASIYVWMSHKDIDAVIWTDLKSNFNDKLGFAFTETHALNYLKYLTLDKKILAEEYVRKAPLEVNTPLRQMIEDEFKWYQIKQL